MNGKLNIIVNMKLTKFIWELLRIMIPKYNPRRRNMMTARSFFWRRPVLFRPTCFRKRKLKYFGWRGDCIHIVPECRGKNICFAGGYSRCFLRFLVYLLNLNFLGQFSEIWPQHKENNWWSKPNFNIFANLQTMIDLNHLKEEKFYLDM